MLLWWGAKLIMKLVFDARVLKFQNTGLSRYTYCLLKAVLQNLNQVHSIIILINENLPDNEKDHICELIDISIISFKIIDIDPFSISQYFFLSSCINKLNPDVYFYPHFNPPLDVKCEKIFVIHDLFPLKVHSYINNFRFLKLFYFKFIIKRALINYDCCIAVSETTKEDLLCSFGRIYEDKIKVVYEDCFNTLESSPIASFDKKQDRPYLLYIGDRRPHKNLKRIIDLFHLLKSKSLFNGRLILVGSTKNYHFNFDQYINQFDGIDVLGQVSDDELTSLYRYATSLIYISKYEGFGLPVLEAANFSKKMILSDGGSLSEIAPEWSYILPNEACLDQHVKAISQYLSSDCEVDSEKYLSQFSWAKSAKKIFPDFVY